MKFFRIILSIILFIVASIIGYFVGNLLSKISILPPQIDRDGIKYCASILLANIGYFSLIKKENKIYSIINIILNVIFAITIFIFVNFGALFSISLILIAIIFFQCSDLFKANE